ncbi:MAG: type II secretion system F family protein [Candidatus Gracilibacteria bacterium]
MFQKAYLARFSRTLSNLLNSGLSIVTTLQINANSMGNEVYRRRILLAMEDIKQGLALAESLTESYLFPSMLIHMIDVGEKTAQLDDMMLKVAHFYENELDTTIAGLSKILEPLILVFIGITVGGVVAAIMMPILQLSTLSDKL